MSVPFCPIHEYRKQRCGEKCAERRKAYRLASHALRNYWSQRKLGQRKPLAVAVLEHPVIKMVPTRRHSALERVRRAIDVLEAFDAEVASELRVAYRNAVLVSNRKRRRAGMAA